MIENIASTIQDLRRIVKDEPSTPIENAISYLDMFLEKLCTHELPEKHTKGLVMHRELIYPLLTYNKTSNLVWAKLRMEAEVQIDELLSNYEESYGLEPVTVAEVEPFLNFEVVNKDGNEHEQVHFKGYKIYKKKVR